MLNIQVLLAFNASYLVYKNGPVFYDKDRSTGNLPIHK